MSPSRSLVIAVLLALAGCKTDPGSGGSTGPVAPELDPQVPDRPEPEPPRPLAPTGETEPNDSPKQANPIAAAQPVDATISSKDVDWYRVDPGASARTLRAEVTVPEGADLEIALFDGTGRDLVRRIDNEKAGRAEVITNVQVDRPMTLRVKAKKAAAGTAYRLVVTLSAPDERAESEPNGSPKKATPITIGGEREGYVNNGDDRDIFQVQPGPAAAPLLAELTWVAGVTGELRIFRANRDAGSVVPLTGGAAVTVGGLAIPTLDAPLFLELRSKGGFNVTDRYRLTVREGTAERLTDVEPNDVAALAAALVPDEPANGIVGWPGDVDWFVFEGGEEEEAGVARVEVDGVPGVTLQVAIAGADGKVLQHATAPEPGAKVLLPNAPLPTGRRYVRVSGAKDQQNQDVPYRMLLSQRDGAGEEREPNDTPEAGAGSALDVGFARRGYVSHAEDVDFYTLDLSRLESGRILTLRLRAPDGVRLKATVTGKDGAQVTAVGEVPGGEERTATQYFEPGVYAVEVRSPDRALGTGAPYILSVVP